jgi:hypothetical protein
MKNEKVMEKTPEKPWRKLSGSFKIAIPGVLFLLVGLSVKLSSQSFHAPIYFFMLSGFLCFVGIICGIAEFIEYIAKRKSSEGARFILLGFVLNVIGWVSAIMVFINSSGDSLRYG